MAKTNDATRRSMTWAGAVALAASVLACGARNDLLGIDGAAGDGDGDGRPTPVAEGAIFFATAMTFQGQSRIASVHDMSGDGYATYAGTGDFFASCVHAFDRNGLLLFTDDATRRVMRLDVDSGRLDEAPFPGSLASAIDVAVDADDRLFIADPEGHRVIRYDRFQDGDGFAFGGLGSGVGQLSDPHGVAVTPDGKILVADTGNHRIVQVDDLVGNGWRTWTAPNADAYLWDITLDAAGRIYVVDFETSSLWRIDDISGGAAAQFSLPGYQLSHVFVADDGRIYLTSLNDTFAVLAMDDMEGTNLVELRGPEDQPLINPCGIVVR